jgi:hypothetical protein
MKKERDQYIFESSAEAPDDPCRYIVSRSDLEGEEIRIYDHYLAKLDHPTPVQLRMLAIYAWLAVKFKQASEDRKLALYIHRCMVYARNRLSLWKQEPVDRSELLLDCEMTWPFYFLYLDNAWSIDKDERT